MNLFDATLEEGAFRIGQQRCSTGLVYSGPVKIGIRPEAIKPRGGIPATIALVENLGARFLIDARVDGNSLLVLSEERPDSNAIKLHIDPKDIHVFDKTTGESLRYRRNGDLSISQSEDAPIAT